MPALPLKAKEWNACSNLGSTLGCHQERLLLSQTLGLSGLVLSTWISSSSLGFLVEIFLNSLPGDVRIQPGISCMKGRYLSLNDDGPFPQVARFYRSQSCCASLTEGSAPVSFFF